MQSSFEVVSPSICGSEFCHETVPYAIKTD